MTPPPELLTGMKRVPLIGGLLAHNGRRRLLFAVLIAISAALALYPERHRAASTLSPSDPQSLGLSGTLGQLGAINTVFGNQAAIEIALRVARSVGVREKVAKKLDLDRVLETGDPVATSRWLARNVDIRSLRGGIVQIELTHSDAQLAQSIIAVWSEATRAQLAEIAVRQTAYKREVLEKLVADATLRMNKAQAAYDRFRVGRRTAEPGFEIGSVSGRIEGLRQAIKGKDLQMRSALQFATPDNISIRQIKAERQALQAELEQALAKRNVSNDTLGSVVNDGTKLIFLERDLVIARGLYDNYNRYLLGTAVEDLTSTANIRILEPPHIDTARQYNTVPLGLAGLWLLLALAFEMQGWRRPAGSAA